MSKMVSVVIPTYNYAQYISEAVNSILQQNYPREQIEIIVIDDGSADNTKEVLQPFIDSKDVQYYFQQNNGKANATSAGIRKSTGKYIFNLDADDYFLPGKIATTVDVFESDASVVHVASPAQIFLQDKDEMVNEKLPDDVLDKVLDGNWLLKRFYHNNILFGGGSTYAARASVLKSIKIPGGVDMYIDEFLLLAILPFGKSFFSSKPLSIWRVHNSNYSGSNNIKDKQVNRAERLLKSSASVLEYVENNHYSPDLVNIYRLQDATRKMAFKELTGTKKTKDILHYGSVVFGIKPNWQIIRKYHVMNRFIPSYLFGLLKKLKAS